MSSSYYMALGSSVFYSKKQQWHFCDLKQQSLFNYLTRGKRLATVLLGLTSECCKDVATIWYNPIVLWLRQRKSKPRSATVSGRTDAVQVATMVLISLTTAFQMDESIIVGLGSVPLQHNARVCLIMINVSPWLGIRKYLGTIVQSAHHHLTSIKASNVVFPTETTRQHLYTLHIVFLSLL